MGSFTQKNNNYYPKPEEQAPQKLFRVFKIASLIQVVVISIYILMFVVISIAQKINPNMSDFSLLGVGLILSYIIIPLFTIATIVNVIGLPIYVFRYRPKGRQLTFSIATLATTGVFIVLFMCQTIYGYYTTNNFVRQSNEESQKIHDQVSRELEAEAAKNTVTKDRVIKLLEKCEVVQFTGRINGTNKSEDLRTEAQLNAAERSISGLIVIKDISSDGSLVYASRKRTLELQNKALQSKQTCSNKILPYIIIDGVEIK